jgi:HK97 family phage portal protein
VSFLLGGPPRQQRGWMADPPIPPNSAGGVSFARVDLSRTESSLQKVAVWACVNLVRTIVEILPLDCFTGQGQDRRPAPMPRFLDDLGGDGFGLADWCSQVVYSGMLRGNAIGLTNDAYRDNRSGLPQQIVLEHPDYVSVYRDLQSGQVVWRIQGKPVDPARIWHHRINPVPGQILGLSPIAMHALTIGTGIAALRFGAQFFEDGAHPSGVLSSDKEFTRPGDADTAKQRFLAAVRGKREPVVLGRGWSFQAIQVPPGEAKFLETNNYTSAECCRIFGPALAEVFGYDTGGSLTYANIEQRSLDLLTYAADPWLVRLERILSALLPAPRYVKFNRAALVRTDLLSRFQAHELALRNRWKVVNEVRTDEEMQPVAWGDEPNFTTYAYSERYTPATPAAEVTGPPTDGGPNA